VRYYEQNLAWTAIPDAFAGGTHRPIGDDPTAEVVPRCRALRLPDPLSEPPFEAFRPFSADSPSPCPLSTRAQ
jgi:hypothetical protein